MAARSLARLLCLAGRQLLFVVLSLSLSYLDDKNDDDDDVIH